MKVWYDEFDAIKRLIDAVEQFADDLWRVMSATTSKSTWRRLPRIGTSDSGFDRSALEKYIWIVRSSVFG